MLHNPRSSLPRHTHLSRIRAVGHPLRARHRRRLLQHSVDLFEGETLGFGNQDDGVDEAEEAEGAPEEEDLRAEVDAAACCGGDVWGDDCDDLVTISSEF